MYLVKRVVPDEIKISFYLYRSENCHAWFTTNKDNAKTFNSIIGAKTVAEACNIGRYEIEEL